jgi:hypothetical protein
MVEPTQTPAFASRPVTIDVPERGRPVIKMGWLKASMAIVLNVKRWKYAYWRKLYVSITIGCQVKRDKGQNPGM